MAPLDATASHTYPLPSPSVLSSRTTPHNSSHSSSSPSNDSRPESPSATVYRTATPPPPCSYSVTGLSSVTSLTYVAVRSYSPLLNDRLPVLFCFQLLATFVASSKLRPYGSPGADQHTQLRFHVLGFCVGAWHSSPLIRASHLLACASPLFDACARHLSLHIACSRCLLLTAVGRAPGASSCTKISFVRLIVDVKLNIGDYSPQIHDPTSTTARRPSVAPRPCPSHPSPLVPTVSYCEGRAPLHTFVYRDAHDSVGVEEL
ncbi:hypothetical protein PI124_g8319 [Phytophthora idaei]|nr:hypothetical protein PI125_g8205 [Phytophthora idaei]KAG3159159.1 hypothetical protein PI126_g7540 [Phytophthora idaei]KAG3246980.1 hypothetical protein PI124_g8319 [Phytophthora idaei]